MTTRRTPATARRGYATFAIIILLMAASAFVTASTLAYRNFHRELRFVEKKQNQRWQTITVTNTLTSLPATHPAATSSLPSE